MLPAFLRTRPWLGVLLVGLLALAVRLPGLARPLWLDECFSLRMAALPPAALVHEARTGDAHPPGYYLVLRAWLQQGPGAQPGEPGSVDLAARSLSLLLGLLHVGVLALLARSLLGREAGWLAGLLAATSGAMAWPAVEVRSFALAALLASTAWLLAWRTVQSGGWLRPAGAALCLAGALWCFYHAALAALALLGFVLALRPPPRRLASLLLAGVGAALLFAPWLPALLEQLAWVRGQAQAGHAGLELGWRGLADRWLNQHLLVTAPAYGLGGLLALPVLLHAGVRGWRGAQGVTGWPGVRAALLGPALPAPALPGQVLPGQVSPAQALPAGHPQALRALLVLLAVGLLGVLAAGLAGTFISHRYATFLAGAWCVLGAAWLVRVPAPTRRWLVLALVAGGAVGSAWSLAQRRHPDWPGAVAALGARAEAGTPVLVEPGFQVLCWRHYAGVPARAVPGELALEPGAPGGLARAWLEPRDEPALRAVLAGRPEAWLVRVRKGPRPEGEALDRALAALGYALRESLPGRGVLLERWALERPASGPAPSR